MVEQGVALPFQQAIAARYLVEGLGHALDDGAVLLLVDYGHGVEHHEEGEDERHVIGIGDQPAIEMFSPLQVQTIALAHGYSPFR